MRLLHISFLVLFALANITASAQKKKHDPCGFRLVDFAEIQKGYQRYHKCLGVKSHETVASVGAGTGRIELQISLFVDSVHWTLQDIDTLCVAKPQLSKSITFVEKLTGKKINSDFRNVLGTTDKTLLEPLHYDRVMMVDVYHELSAPEAIIRDIGEALKSGGTFVMLERMGQKRGEIHGCKFPKVLEEDLIPDLKRYGFELESKVVPNEKLDLTYYTFKKI